jgi:hypothetical protein
MWAQEIPKDVFLGLSAIPDSTDCENLYSAIESGELTRDFFGRFCSAHELPDNLPNAGILSLIQRVGWLWAEFWVSNIVL